MRSPAPLRRRFARLAITMSLVFAACGPSAPSAGDASPSGVAVAPSRGGASQPASSPPCRPAPGAPTDLPWWTDRVFYEVFVRSFADSDGDGIGDLAGLTGKLDYLNDGDPATHDDLGVTGIWLMPVAESPSYHGYDVVDYRAIERDYGTTEDFAGLIAAAHERGIEVIVDLVMNHTSRDHPWFREAITPGSAHDDWYVWSDERPAIARSDGSRVWHEAGGRFYYGYFWEGMPDLDVENPDVTAELDSIARFWLEEMGADGFRLDAARHLVEDGEELENTEATFAWLVGFRERLKSDHPDALVLGEVWDAPVMSARYVEEGALDVAFEFGLAAATLTSIRSGDAGSLRAAQRETAERYPLGGVATFITNHDQNRVMSELGGDPAAARLAAAILLTGPGTPFVYYGEEIGLTGRKPDERIRTPMRWDASEPAAGFSTAVPWQPLGEDPPGADVASQSDAPDSLLSTYRALIALRASTAALATGELTVVDAEPASVAAWLRHTPQGDVALVVANLADEAVDRPTLTLEAGPLCGSADGAVLHGPAAASVEPPAINPGGGFDAWSPVASLGPRQALVVDLGADD